MHIKYFVCKSAAICLIYMHKADDLSYSANMTTHDRLIVLHLDTMRKTFRSSCFFAESNLLNVTKGPLRDKRMVPFLNGKQFPAYQCLYLSQINEPCHGDLAGSHMLAYRYRFCAKHPVESEKKMFVNVCYLYFLDISGLRRKETRISCRDT